MSYVKSKSWHTVLTFTRNGSVLTRCGRLIPGPDHQMADSLPLGERSCESCLRLAVHDGEAIATDPVVDAPPPDSDVVAG